MVSATCDIRSLEIQLCLKWIFRSFVESLWDTNKQELFHLNFDILDSAGDSIQQQLSGMVSP
jgi:hypothetical protein